MKIIKLDTNYDNMISMLTGEQFYDTQEVYLRELLQNACDACHVRMALEWSWGTEFLELEEAEILNSVRRTFEPRIVVSYNSESGMLFVEDNGIGINEEDLGKYIAHLGSSYYASEDFKAQRLKYEPVSQFGIGLCSCFRVSRAILIESRKDKTINTAWNVLARQSLAPIAVKWFKNSDHLEYINSNRSFSGTRVTLALQPKVAMGMSLSYLVRAIQSFMAYQDIPIDIYFDKKKVTLFEPKMKLPVTAYVVGITTLKVDNELLEGYVTLYNGKHRHLIEESVLYQQGFRVTTDVEGLGLKPEWLRHMGLCLNVKKRFLNLKLTRDDVAKDERLHQLRESIGQIIINYFQKNPIGLSQYMEDGRTHCILSEYDSEMNLLLQAVNVSVYLKNKEIELVAETIVNGFMGREIKAAYMSHALFVHFRDNYSVDFKEFLARYPLIVFEKNRETFTQLLSPYIRNQSYEVTEIPGIVYTELSLDFGMKKSVAPYRKNYQLYPPQKTDDVIFCFVSNERGGAFDLILNENHRNTQMLLRARNHPKVANLCEVIKENIKQRILNPQRSWGRLIDFGGSFVDEWTSEMPPSVQSVWCLENDFAVSLNEFIQSKLSYEELVEYGLEGLVFHKTDFIYWWYPPK